MASRPRGSSELLACHAIHAHGLHAIHLANFSPRLWALVRDWCIDNYEFLIVNWIIALLETGVVASLSSEDSLQRMSLVGTCECRAGGDDAALSDQHIRQRSRAEQDGKLTAHFMRTACMRRT